MIHIPPNQGLEVNFKKSNDDPNSSTLKKGNRRQKKDDSSSLYEYAGEKCEGNHQEEEVSVNGEQENPDECADEKAASKPEASTSYNEEDFMFEIPEDEINGKVGDSDNDNDNDDCEEGDGVVDNVDEISSKEREEIFDLNLEDEISENNDEHDDLRSLGEKDDENAERISLEESQEVTLREKEEEPGNTDENLERRFKKNSKKSSKMEAIGSKISREKKEQINEESQENILRIPQEDDAKDLDNADLETNEPMSEQILLCKASNTDPSNFTSLDETNPEMNILILGQSGVGKSTWINSILNYLAYENLEKAEIGGVLSVIPTSFVVTCVTDDEVIKQVVQVGDEDPNEKTDLGKSGTQEPQTYTFYLGKKIVRLIDTPGLGDTEGIGRDKEHLNNILNHISFLNEIHGICILLKPNETRFGALFSFCISELLINLHKNAAKNIVFCFTNSRMTFYAPGETSEVLEQFLRDLNLSDVISLSKQTMFCLDNEAFRYLCTLKYDHIPKRELEREEYNRSWIKSVAETRRLFDTIKALEPHRVADTTYLCSVRSKLYNLMEPIADISKTIQMNLAMIENQQQKINVSKQTVAQKFKKLNIKAIVTKSSALDYSRMVCAGENCVRHYKLESSNLTVAEYPQICHEKCRLRNVIDKAGSDKKLKECRAFNFKGNCRKCKCSWKSHKHQTYVLKKEEIDVINSVIEDEIVEEINEKGKLEKNKLKMETFTKIYRQEQDVILQTCLKFEAFLRKNGLSQYSDTFKEYLKELILEEKKKVNTTLVDGKLLNNLNELLNRYEEETKKREADMGSESINLTSADVMVLIEKLYNLKLTGGQIKSNAELTIKSNQRNQMHAEKPLPVGPVSYLD